MAGLTVRQMLDERERLQGLIDNAQERKAAIDAEAREAKAEMALLNQLIALRGDKELAKAESKAARRTPSPGKYDHIFPMADGLFHCLDSTCERTFASKQGFSMHLHRSHPELKAA